MTANALRCQIIAHVLKADRLHLQALAQICDEQSRILLPADLPEWISLAHAAQLLHLHPAHLRRLVTSRYPLQVERRKSAKGQPATFLARSCVEQLACASVRHSRAKRASKSAHLAGNAHLSTRAHHSPTNDDSNTVTTA